jgi:hypothetical protein
MATEKELRALVTPVLEHHPSLTLIRRRIFIRPIGLYFRGCILKQSAYGPFDFQLLHFVSVLFAAPMPWDMNWSRGCAIPGFTNHGWEIEHPDFSKALDDLISTVIIPETAHVTSGAAFLGYLEKHKFTLGWPNYAKALAYIHMGELEVARALLIPMANDIRTRFPEIAAEGAWGHNLLELLRLIEEDRDAIPAHCEAVAKKSVAFNKLEKYWEPTPFVYVKDR